jgi:hypothetical protein
MPKECRPRVTARGINFWVTLLKIFLHTKLFAFTVKKLENTVGASR